MMDTIQIKYCFKFTDRQQKVISLQLDPQTLRVVNRSSGDLPEWTLLTYHQCPHCPLEVLKNRHCPVAVSLVDVVTRFRDVKSHEDVDLEVTTVERKVSQYTLANRGISSLVGLLISTSGCPYTDFFKPMARFHLPLASEEDTLFRVIGMYLLGQYFRKKAGEKGGLELQGLAKIYENIHLLNVNIAERLRSATSEDSSLNAVIVLDAFTHAFQNIMEKDLVDFQRLFLPYLSGFYNELLEDVRGGE